MTKPSSEELRRGQWLEEWEAWKTLPLTQLWVKYLGQQAAMAQSEWTNLLGSPRPDPEHLRRSHDETRAVMRLIDELEELDGEAVWNQLQAASETGRA